MSDNPLCEVVKENAEAAVEPIAEAASTLTMNAAGPLSKSLGDTLGDIWYLVFGKIGFLAERQKLKYAHDLNLFKEELEQKTAGIPEERRIEPSTQVAMNAMSSAQACIEEPELRCMFSNLLASACDDSTAASVHPSFPEIIRRMAPADALLLDQLTCRTSHPVVEYMLNFVNKSGGYPQGRNVIAINGVVPADFLAKARSLEILQSLGLINITYLSHLTDESAYKPFENCSYYHMLSVQAQANPGDALKVSFEKGLVTFTSTGKQFISVCLNR